MSFLKPDIPELPPAPEIPEPDSPLAVAGLDAFFNRTSSFGPYGATVYGSYDAEGNFLPWGGPETIALLSAALADPKNPDMAALLSAMPTSVVNFEDPRLRDTREQSQDMTYGMNTIAQGYMAPFGFAGVPSESMMPAWQGEFLGQLGGAGGGPQVAGPMGGPPPPPLAPQAPPGGPLKPQPGQVPPMPGNFA